MNYTILSPNGVEKNFQDWNVLQQRYNSRSYVPKRQPPKRLIQNAIKEFESFCETYHIDASKYKFIEPCEIEGDWRQFDFKDSEGRGSTIAMHSIIYQKGYKIVQMVIDLA